MAMGGFGAAGIPFCSAISVAALPESETFSNNPGESGMGRVVDAAGGSEFQKGGWHLHWLDVAAPLGLGGLWLGYFFQQLKGRPLLALNDPGLKEAMAASGK
jgi:hypothetical protein